MSAFENELSLSFRDNESYGLFKKLSCVKPLIDTLLRYLHKKIYFKLVGEMNEM
jgi:hypothetical protein